MKIMSLKLIRDLIGKYVRALRWYHYNWFKCYVLLRYIVVHLHYVLRYTALRYVTLRYTLRDVNLGRITACQGTFRYITLP